MDETERIERRLKLHDLRVLMSVVDQGSMAKAAERLATGPVAGLVGIEGGVVSGVINLESPDVSASGRRPRHENRYHDA